MYGKTHTDETRKKFSELHKGNTYRKGIIASEKTRQKMSENAKLKIGEKNPFYGKHHSEETIQKIKEKSKGRLPPNTIKISVDNIIYISISEAARQLNMPAPTVLWRLKSNNPKFDNYKYVNEENFKQSSETLSEDDVDNYELQNLQLDNR
jgi:group I intron endonuclease